MTINIDRKAVAGAVICLGALFFALGADSPSASSASAPAPKWAICGVPGSVGDAYIINQQTGNLYYMQRKASIGSKKMKLQLLGSITDAE